MKNKHLKKRQFFFLFLPLLQVYPVLKKKDRAKTGQRRRYSTMQMRQIRHLPCTQISCDLSLALGSLQKKKFEDK